MHRTRTPTSLAIACAALLGLAGCTEDGGDAGGDAGSSEDREGPGSAHAMIMANARNVSADIDTPAEALAAGYIPAPFCVPGMGIHWTLDSALDTELDTDVPEVVLFLPPGPDILADDQLFLGIEHVVIVEGTANNATDAGPYLFGMPLHGPMEGHTPTMPWHKELHIYLADGMESGADFRESRDSIECPMGTVQPALFP